MTQPASSCGHCGKQGHISADQNSRSGLPNTPGKPLTTTIRFHCSCGNEWLADTHWAHEHGRFLDRIGMR